MYTIFTVESRIKVNYDDCEREACANKRQSESAGEWKIWFSRGKTSGKYYLIKLDSFHTVSLTWGFPPATIWFNDSWFF